MRILNDFIQANGCPSFRRAPPLIGKVEGLDTPDDSDTAVTAWQGVGVLFLFMAEATLLAGGIALAAWWLA